MRTAFLMSSNATLSRLKDQARHSLRILITGGDWALALPQESRRNLYRYWFDGLFAAVSDTIPINYLSLYLLAVGASGAQVGWFSALSSLAAAVCLLPGALIVERFGHRKEFTVVFGGLLARMMLMAMALAPLGGTGQGLVWGVIVMGILRSAVGNLAYPAWMSITGDIIPIEGRGRYFGSRNFVMGIASMVMTYLVGEFITRVGSPQGYQITLVLSFVGGMVSTYFFWRIRDPQAGQPVHSAMAISLAGVWKDLRAAPIFLAFCLVSALWNFSLNIAGPFFNVYMAQNLGFTAAMIGLTSVATSVTRLFAMPKLGELADRWGPGRVQLFSMFLIPLLPLTWVFISQLWQVVALNAVGGVFWGMFELASFNFLLLLTPDAQRARYAAIYQVVVTVALAGGAALGSTLISSTWGYTAVFLTSAAGRVSAAILFWNLMRKIQEKKQ